MVRLFTIKSKEQKAIIRKINTIKSQVNSAYSVVNDVYHTPTSPNETFNDKLTALYNYIKPLTKYFDEDDINKYLVLIQSSNEQNLNERILPSIKILKHYENEFNHIHNQEDLDQLLIKLKTQKIFKPILEIHQQKMNELQM